MIKERRLFSEDGKPIFDPRAALSSAVKQEETVAPHRWNGQDNSASARLQQGLVVPTSASTFSIARDADVFAIGSCFARHLETMLCRQGARVTSVDDQHELMEVRTNSSVGRLNKFDPISIHQELSFACGASQFPEDAYLASAAGDDRFVDPSIRESGALSKEEVQARRHSVTEYFRKAFSADVVVVTLGLTETWVDQFTSLRLAEAPNRRLLTEHPSRFRFERLNYADTLNSLLGIHNMLLQFGKPGVKVIATVSPVPLTRTFTGQDVIVANTASKTLLRSAVEAWVERCEEVDYFPSYEAATVSDARFVWEADRRTVRDTAVETIVSTFMQRYFEPADSAIASQS